MVWAVIGSRPAVGESYSSSGGFVTTARATVGARTNRLDTALGRLQQLEESTTKLLSNTEDADMAKTLVDFSQQQAVYQAALKSGAQVIQLSLMDFLR